MPPEHPTCALHDNVVDGLREMSGKLDTILAELKSGAVTFATVDATIKALSARVDMLEKVCYGTVAIVMVTVLGVALAHFVKS